MKKALVASLLIALMVIPIGCNNQKNIEPQELKKVTVLLDWTPNTNHTGVYAAKKLGYYKEQGLDIEIVQASEGGTSQLVGAGKGDFGFSYQEEVTIARTEGVPVKAVAAIIQHNTSGFASPVDKRIKSPKDFEGKNYGGWGSPAEDVMIKALMNQEKADFNKVTMINIGSSDFFTSVKKDVDFAWIYWGWTGIESELRGMSLNFIRLIDYNSALDFYSPVLIASEKTINDDPNLVANFMKATTKGYRYCIQNPENAGQILLESVSRIKSKFDHSQPEISG